MLIDDIFKMIGTSFMCVIFNYQLVDNTEFLRNFYANICKVSYIQIILFTFQSVFPHSPHPVPPTAHWYMHLQSPTGNSMSYGKRLITTVRRLGGLFSGNVQYWMILYIKVILFVIKYVCICAYTYTCIFTMYVTFLWQGQKQIYKIFTCFLSGRKGSTFKF